MNSSSILLKRVSVGGRFQPALHFTGVLLKANLKNAKALALSLGLPLFMLFNFWITTRGQGADEFDLMAYMFPAIVALAVMLAGLTQATRITRWREQGIFQRFALTPVPLPALVLGAALAQVATGLLQGIAILAFGVMLSVVVPSVSGLLTTLGVMILSAVTFIAFGSLIATFAGRSDLAGYIFFFTFMPLFFLGSFPGEMLPPVMQQIIVWLPTTMSIELIGHQFVTGALPEHAAFSLGGLAIYAVVFGSVSARFFKWEAE
jgi:ABC-type multidrug transport system permease subunit